MSSRRVHIDKFFLGVTAALTIVGFIIFLSASLGLLAKDGANFGLIALKQGASLAIGAVAFYVISRIHYTILRKSALVILIGAIVVNLLLFIPALSLNINGASRWIAVGPITFQPSEFLKIAFIIYLAAWIQFAKDRVKLMKYGLLPYLILMAILSALLLSQRDTDTLAIIGVTGIIMLFLAGMRLRQIAIAGIVMIAVVVGVVALRPYALERIKTYIHPDANSQGSSYQINQSLIAIGSGGMFGRGFGQSVQKFGYLPQSTDDSIFAVAAEEFGFFGMTILLSLYCLFAAAAFRIGTRAPDVFGGMVACGIGILVVTESFLNMAAMLGIIPLSGLPLLFVSHGGTALVITLSAAGIVANISKHRR